MANSTCHGNTGSAPHLGLADGGAENPMTILATIVNVKSGEEPAMNLVTPGDATQSYLMHKVDHDQCTLASECATVFINGIAYYPTCGADMPFQADQLSSATRNLIRAWIDQGALDN